VLILLQARILELLQGDDWAPEYRQIHRRARLHAARLPPDALNPRGAYDGRLRPVFSRFTRARKGRDERSGYLPLGLPPPGAQWSQMQSHASFIPWPCCCCMPASLLGLAEIVCQRHCLVVEGDTRCDGMLGFQSISSVSADMARSFCLAYPGLYRPVLVASRADGMLWRRTWSVHVVKGCCGRRGSTVG